MNIRVVIVEDEPLAQEILEEYLVEIPGLQLVGKFYNGYDGLKGIQELAPDLLLLDINLPKISGFELLELLDAPPQVIFVTAYDTYAVKAFEVHALDYLLKPFTKERLKTAVEKARERIALKDMQNLERVTQDVQIDSEPLERVVVKTGAKIDLIPVGDIHYLRAEDDYVGIHTAKGRFLKLKPMKYFEVKLDASIFCRVHRSFMVNLSQVIRIEPYEKERYRLILRSGIEVPVSKSGRLRLKNALG
ncbi:LytR/AlgR family response regulator transcription factor [Pleomorphovibrio marinus]|uniref:LytR/AlgR family response regulator transcription factor n=1 Tax=Pleomorphovibrio marinus TaxID=2164132 RepID=UPI000E0A9F13|nr:LytTR family DNA-binding domain-containing protein [Pleomorphovibrio marinus]